MPNDKTCAAAFSPFLASTAVTLGIRHWPSGLML